MRILGSEEQNLCNLILNAYPENNYLGNIIDHKLGGVCISVTRDQQSVDLLFTIQKGETPTDEESVIIIERIKEISMVILTTVNLIKMLEKDGYIMLLQRANNIQNKTQFGGCISNLPFIYSGLGDKYVSKLLIEYIDKEIIVTEEFREFCSHGYIARDERRFRRQNRNAIIAISIAFFAAFTNLFFNIWTKISGTRIKTEQVESLKDGLKDVGEKIDTLDSTANRTIHNFEKLKDKELRNPNIPNPK